MQRNYKKSGMLLLSLLLLGITVLSMSACGQTWDWLWSRDSGGFTDTDLLILGDEIPEGDTEMIFEGAVEYTGDAHSGTDIYYLGKKGSPNRSRIIVIDAGHQLKGSSALEPNGPNSEIMKDEVIVGATGVSTGQTEYDLNLAVALLLRDELIRRGYSVVMIRETNNVHISNMARAEIANKYSAAAFVRIYANSWTDETMRGATTICQTEHNPYPTCAIHYTRSNRLSRFVLDEFCEQTGMSKMKMQESDDMTGTNWSEVPTTVLKMGFLSNRSEDRLMSTDFFRQEAAIGVANGLDAYFAWLETQLPTWDSVELVTSPEKPSETPDAATVRDPSDDLTEEPAEDSLNGAIDAPTEEPTQALTENEAETPAEDPAHTSVGTSADTSDEPPTDESVTGTPAELETDESAYEGTAEAETIFEHATPYTGEAHEGVNICYEGAVGSRNRNRIIVIDPGHQLVGSSALEPNGPGSDIMKAQVSWGSAGAFTGQSEYELNLAVALLLRDELIRRGYSVVMVRETNEVSISNMERALLANEYDTAAFIRIHANGWIDDSMKGAMTISQSQNNPYPTCAAQYEASDALSRAVLSAFCEATGMKDLGKREMDDQTGVNWSEVPTTTVEMGFLSNEADDRLMATEDFRAAAAEGIANGLDAYFASLNQQ